MATVRGMTPEAIRALLKREIGDYQALSIAVNSAKGASDSAVAEVENIRKDLENMDFDFDTSQLDKAMEKFETDMTELNQNLDELKDEALARENKLSALEIALNKDRSEFNQEMQKMAKELSDSKTQLEKDLSETSEKLAQNLTDVGANLSSELEKVNKTVKKDLAKDLSNLDRKLQTIFSESLNNVADDLNSRAYGIDKDLNDYKSKTDSKMGTLLSEIDKAKAYADGFMQPGNLVWNPMALDNARDIFTNNYVTRVTYNDNTGRPPKTGITIRKNSDSTSYISYGGSKYATFDVKDGNQFQISAWVKSTNDLPARALGFLATKCAPEYAPPIPANTWTKVSVDVSVRYGGSDSFGFFQVYATSSIPVGTDIIISEPHAVQKTTSDLIVDGAVTSQSLATGAVTAGKIAADAVTANNILAGSIGAREIAAKSIGADQLAANAVTADKIAANAVDADKIKAKAIGTDQLAANAVTADKIKANAVTSAKIDSEAVTAQKLAAGAVTADKIAAHSITANHMVLAQPGNLIANGSLSAGDAGWDSSLYYQNANQSVPPTGRYLITKPGQGSMDAQGYDKWFDVQPGASYAFEIWLYSDKPGSLFYLACRNQDGNHAGSAGKTVNEGDLWSGGGVYLITARTLSTGWRRYSCVYTMDSNTTRARLGTFFFNHPNGKEQNARVAFAGVSMRPMADASLIVEGGIQAGHIASKAITTDHMSANSIDGDRIKSNTLDADKIRAKSLTSDHVTFKNGFIKEAMIGNAQITSGKIKELDAGKITTGTMSGYRIQAGTLDANRIKAGTLSADQIATGTMSGDRIQSNTLDANRIKAGTLSADQIATGTLNSDRIAANSITVKELRAGTIVPIGGSLIPSEPKVSGGVPEPIWWEVCDNELAANYSGYPRPEGNPWRLCSTAQSKQQTVAPPQRLVKIKPGQKYRLTFWCRSTKPDTTLYIEMRDQNGSHAVKSGAVYGSVNSGKYLTKKKSDEDWPVTDFSESKTGSYLVANFTMPTSITKVTSTIEFKEDVEYVSLRNFYFNHSNGSNQGNQWLAGLSLELEIPDQQAIDARQDDAIDRMDKDATFLNGVMMNIARMLVRAEQNKADSTLLTTNFEGTLLYGMLGIRTSSNGQVDLYISPEWKGRIEFIANCSVGAFNGTPATWFRKVTDDDFTTHTTSSVRVAPPTPFKHNGKFKYTRVDVRPRGEGVLDQLSVAIYHVPSYYEMFQLLTTKEITRVGMLEYGRSTSDPEPKLKEAPSWERRGSGLSSRR